MAEMQWLGQIPQENKWSYLASALRGGTEAYVGARQKTRELELEREKIRPHEQYVDLERQKLENETKMKVLEILADPSNFPEIPLEKRQQIIESLLTSIWGKSLSDVGINVSDLFGKTAPGKIKPKVETLKPPKTATKEKLVYTSPETQKEALSLMSPDERAETEAYLRTYGLSPEQVTSRRELTGASKLGLTGLLGHIGMAAGPIGAGAGLTTGLLATQPWARANLARALEALATTAGSLTYPARRFLTPTRQPIVSPDIRSQVVKESWRRYRGR